MSEYSGIRGTRVKYLASDPTLNTSTEGQVWYNSTSGTLKSLVQIKAWSSGGNMGTAREQTAGGGTQAAAFVCGGAPPPSPASALTEEYGGFSWSAGGTLNTGRRLHASAGTQTAGLAFAGKIYNTPTPNYTTTSEEYDGSSWTSGGTMNTERRDLAGFGIQTAGVAVGGRIPPDAETGATEEYNGTAWTSSPGSLNTVSQNLAAAGILTAGIVFGGAPDLDRTEEYDGSTWTTVNNMNTGRQLLTGSGIQTSALAASGSSDGTLSPSIGVATEEYDGTNWTNSTNMSTARFNGSGLQGTGTRSQGLVSGGYTTTAVGTTEEYNSNINAITQAAWASGGNLNSPRLNGGQGIGTQTAGAIFGGNTTSITYPYVTSTEQYDGSTWTSGGSRSVGTSDAGAFGTLTAGVAFGGYSYPPNVSIANTEEYDGSSWTSGGNLGTSRYASGGAGILTAGLAIGGQNRPNPSPVRQSSVEVYDGTSWSAGTALPTATNSMASGGTQTAAIIAGGSDPSAPTIAKSYSWNGSVWTTNPNIGTSRYKAFGSGGPTSSSSWIIAAGNVPPATNAVELWDGTGFSSHASLSTARNQHMNGSYGNTNSQAFVAGGTPPATGLNNTEEYSGGTEVATASTLTTS